MNKVILKGRVSNDIEMKYTQSTNTAIASFGIAIQRNFKNKEGQYDTDFFNCSAFGKTAEFINNYITKGQEILIVGNLQNNVWVTDDNQKRTATKVIVETVEFCGIKSAKTTEIDINNANSDELPF